MWRREPSSAWVVWPEGRSGLTWEVSLLLHSFGPVWPTHIITIYLSALHGHIHISLSIIRPSLVHLSPDPMWIDTYISFSCVLSSVGHELLYVFYLRVIILSFNCVLLCVLSVFMYPCWRSNSVRCAYPFSIFLPQARAIMRNL